MKKAFPYIIKIGFLLSIITGQYANVLYSTSGAKKEKTQSTEETHRSQLSEPHKTKDIKRSNLTSCAQGYIDFLKQFSHEEGINHPLTIQNILSQFCTKNINGKRVANNLDEISHQMFEAKQHFGNFEIDEGSIDIIVDVDANICDVRFIFITLKDNIHYLVSTRITWDGEKISAISDVHSTI